MYHSVTFGDFNTWDKWHLLSEIRPSVNPPEVKTEYLEIPGADGELDYTEVLSGLKYKNRKGSWDFTVENGFMNWHELCTDIMSNLHGKKMKVILEDDPGFYYFGRISVDALTPGHPWSTITIGYNFEPYKYSSKGTGRNDWLWDELIFSNSYIIQYGMFDVSGTKERNLINTTNETIEIVTTCTSAMTVTFERKQFELPSGTTEKSRIFIKPGDNEMTFTGNGKVTIEYDVSRRL